MLINIHMQDVCSGEKNIPEVKCSTTLISREGGVLLGESSHSIQKGMRIGAWEVMSLYRAGSLKAAARELARYKLDVVGVQEVRRDKGGTVRAGDYNFFYGKGN